MMFKTYLFCVTIVFLFIGFHGKVDPFCAFWGSFWLGYLFNDLIYKKA